MPPPRAPAAIRGAGLVSFPSRVESKMDTDIPNQAPHRQPGPEAEARSALLRLLRLLAMEVARRFPAPHDPDLEGPPRDP